MTALAVDIGGTKIAAARVSESGDILGQVVTVSTPATEGPEAVLRAAAAALGRLGGGGARVVAVSSAGVIDSSSGTVLAATSSIRGWAGTDIAGELGRATGHRVHAMGDGHAFAVGAATHGAAAEARSVLVLAAGTGVGGSYVVDGQPLLGAHWAAGHFGHVSVPQADGLDCYCGRTGHLEAIGSGAGMLRWYLAHGGHADVRSARDLMGRPTDDLTAARAIELAAGALGVAAAGLANSFDPEMMVVAGGLTHAGPRWLEPLVAAFRASLIPVLHEMPLVVSHADEWLALRGAAHYALTREGNQ